jgi:hypothetical protein
MLVLKRISIISFAAICSMLYITPSRAQVPPGCSPAERATHFADVTGDGKADAIAVRGTAIWVSPSDGGKFVAASMRMWTAYRFYGDIGTYFADVTGDGKADAIAVSRAGIVVNRSNGWQFSPTLAPFPGQPRPPSFNTGPYYGDRGTYFADVTGDGKADAIVVNSDKITVRPSDGTQFLPNQSWTTGPYYGNAGTYFADVTGDGKADAIVVNWDFVFRWGSVTVRRSDGTQFLPNETWATYYNGNPQDFADVTGDGKADAIDTFGVTVGQSDGTRFLPNQYWAFGHYYDWVGRYFADVTGDGKADAIFVNMSGVMVRPSDGAGFIGPQPWLEPFYGDAYYSCIG